MTNMMNWSGLDKKRIIMAQHDFWISSSLLNCIALKEMNAVILNRADTAVTRRNEYFADTM